MNETTLHTLCSIANRVDQNLIDDMINGGISLSKEDFTNASDTLHELGYEVSWS